MRLSPQTCSPEARASRIRGTNGPTGDARRTVSVWHTATMILTLKGRALSPAAKLFLAQLREIARPLST
jgi:hypothetical protein